MALMNCVIRGLILNLDKTIGMIFVLFGVILLNASSASRRKRRKWDKTYPRSTLIEHIHQM